MATVSGEKVERQFVEQAEADLMAALGISDSKKAANDQMLADSSSPDAAVMKDAAGDSNGSQELAGLSELLPEVNMRKPGGGTGIHPLVAAEDQRAGGPEDSVDSVSPHAETGEEEDGGDSKPVMAVRETFGRQSSMRNNLSNEVADASGHSKSKVTSGSVDEHAYDNPPGALDTTSIGDYPDSENALEEDYSDDPSKIPKEFVNMSSGQSISTATQTQTHDVRMPMYLPNFKPATGCTNASDFIVRCFVARLRSGITVVKHGRSRWCKSRLRVLQIHPDGRSLSWKPAEGEPSSSKKPPRLDLTACLEVRHAWSPDPQNPMYTGTPILRQKCEAANAHKSFALIFKNRTVDITAVTADQCKVLMEGFSALCFRLQVANVAGGRDANRPARPMPEEDGASTTASVTLTNNSTPRNR
jgi:microcystin-dependent protein